MSQGSPQEEGFGLGQIPAGGFDYIVLEAQEGPDALESVDDDRKLGGPLRRDNHDGNKLPHFGDGSHEPLLPLSAEEAESLVAQIKLV